MTRIIPAVQAEIVEALSPRVRKRVDAYLAEAVKAGPVTVVGGATVRLAEVGVVDRAEQISCDCLLAPRCAHRAVVALLLELADGEDAEAGEAGPGGEGPGSGQTGAAQKARRAGGSHTDDKADAANHSGGSGGGAGSSGAHEPAPLAAPQARRPLTDAQHRAAVEVLERLGALLLAGTSRLGASSRGALARDLHLLRVQGLLNADRALTAFVQHLGDAPRERARAFATASLNLHQLAALAEGAEAGELLGTARGAYRKVGSLSLVPLYAEPVLAASGFAGVQVVYADAAGRSWSVARLRPGDGTELQSVYEAEQVWRELSVPPLRLSRHKLLLTNATARADGRLGAGAQVRAALGTAGTGWELVPEPFAVVEGEISGGNRHGLEVEGHFLSLREAARARGAGLATELFGAALGTRVRCLSRDGELLGLRVVSGIITVPAALDGVWWPGLDVVDRSWVGALPPLPENAEEDADEPTASGPAEVRQVTARWCERVLDAGTAVLASPALARDVEWLRAAGAPFAAELLEALGAATRVGSRRFDGTWEADAAVLLRAWLALSQY